jgi:hypothetical protein
VIEYAVNEQWKFLHQAAHLGLSSMFRSPLPHMRGGEELPGA